MKTRQGFVSNSSSSSFIIDEADTKIFINYDIKFIKVSDLIEKIKVIIDKAPDNYTPVYLDYYTLKESGLEEYSFLDGDARSVIEELKHKPLDKYITEPYDRDMAFEANFNFELFEGDL